MSNELKLKAAREIVAELEAKVEAAKAELKESQAIEIARTLQIGTWECDESPINICVYAGDMDDCIYCHGPDERK